MIQLTRTAVALPAEREAGVVQGASEGRAVPAAEVDPGEVRVDRHLR